jgi:hypothetical protein
MRNFSFAGIFLALFLSVFSSKADVDVSVGLNFSELNDYGEWVHVHGLGRVWRPDAEEGWRPFMYGHWVYSNEGWLWDSDEPFGWMVCHYGSWYHDDDQGWVWVPGYEWSPARVEWYVTDNEIGWAPMFPPGHHHRYGRDHWMFCPTPMFTSIEVRDHLEIRPRPSHEVSVHVYAGAPRIDFVRRYVHAPIVRITPNKVRVDAPGHSLFKVEVGNRPRIEVVVPVRSKSHRTEVRVEPEHRSHEVIVEHRAPPPENKVHVEVKSRHDDDRDNRRDDDNDRERHRAKIELNIR